ncbi:protein SAAL1 isoform X2 [Monodelphis domestica]|uniref:protein SAAL1 isoform X2 n=1 Tax=Monodelphis domestica TaxID=13616 RepID=UPI00044364AE|nr:protein SAAL1 isoform X2 [Monodelphis domestica]
MDRNPSPPWRELEAEAETEAEGARGDAIGATIYSKHWLFGVLSSLIQLINPEKAKADDQEEEPTELDEELENEICRVWDMSMDKDVALFLYEFNAPDIFMGVLAKTKCPRLMEICVGILGNMACFQEICVSISNDKNIGQTLLHCLYDLDPPTLLEISRLLLTCLSQPQVANVWVERIRENPAVYDSICFIMSSSTNVDLLVKVGEVVDKLFDLDEKLMVEWIRNGTDEVLDQSSEDLEEKPPLKIVPCVLEAAKQIRSDNPVGLDVYMHILQLLTTVDDGIQAIDLPLIGSLIRVLHNMEDCQQRSVNLDSNTEETEKSEVTEDDFHLTVLKDVSCELLSNVFQDLTKENIIQALKEDHLNKQKCFCAFKNLLPLYCSVVEDFLKVLCDVDKLLADDLEKDLPSLKAQTKN